MSRCHSPRDRDRDRRLALLPLPLVRAHVQRPGGLSLSLSRYAGHTLYDLDRLLQLNGGAASKSFRGLCTLVAKAGKPPKPLAAPEAVPPLPEGLAWDTATHGVPSLAELGARLACSLPAAACAGLALALALAQRARVCGVLRARSVCGLCCVCCVCGVPVPARACVWRLTPSRRPGYDSPADEAEAVFVGGERAALRRMDAFLAEEGGKRAARFEKPKTLPVALPTCPSTTVRQPALFVRVFLLACVFGKECVCHWHCVGSGEWATLWETAGRGGPHVTRYLGTSRAVGHGNGQS